MPSRLTAGFALPCQLFLAATLLALLPAAGAHAAEPPAPGVVAYRGARIHPVSGPVIDRGVLIVEGGKIRAVGPDGEVAIPEGAAVRDLAGRVIIPGLVDTHSHIGLFGRPAVPSASDGNEGSGPVQPALRALDGINPDDPGLRMAVAGGVTTANIMPGSGNAIGGQTLYVKLRGRTVEEMRLDGLPVLGGLKMANGENPKRFNFERNKQPPATRMKIASLQREQFLKARDYLRQQEAYQAALAAGRKATPPERDLALDPLVEVLQRKRTVHFHCHRADDLATALRLADEFGFELVLQHATEGYRVADEIARRKVPASLTLLDSPGGKVETAGLIEENAAVLERAGVKVAINTDDGITESRFFLRTGAIAVRGGLSEASALRALTLTGAEILHAEGRVGSLAAGRDADFVVLSGPPFSIYTQVLETYIDGRRLFAREQGRDWTYQAGGFALPNPDRLPPRPDPLTPPQPVKAPAAPAGAPAFADNPARYAVLAGRLHTVSGGTIADGAVLVDNGKLVYVGPRAGLNLPPGTPVLTAAEVTPGLIDAHTVVSIGGSFNLPADQDLDETADPNGSDLRVLDAFNPADPLLTFLKQNGVTVVHAVPGRANVIAGQTGVFHTDGGTAERMLVARFPSALLVNLGESVKQAGKPPTTRMATAALVRRAFAQAQAEAAKPAEADKPRPRNLKTEALILALEGKVPVVFSGHRADDLRTALRLADEFKLRARLDMATEAYLVPEVIAAAKVPVVVHPTMQRAAGSLETWHSQTANAAVLARHGIPLAIGTGFESYVPKVRVVRHEAGMAMVNGLGFDRALRAVTLDAARILGIDARFGSLQVGKEADLVLYDGHPFEHATHVTHTIQAGRLVHDRAAYLKLPFERRALPLSSGGGTGCCLDLW